MQYMGADYRRDSDTKSRASPSDASLRKLQARVGINVALHIQASRSEGIHGMKERPILMAGDNPRLIIEGKKTQTRRIVKPQPAIYDFGPGGVHPAFMPPQIIEGFQAVGLPTMLKDDLAYLRNPPYGIAGDRLWVRETWRARTTKLEELVQYRSDLSLREIPDSADLPPDFFSNNMDYGDNWRPSIHMPRWASRMTLEIIKVRVERLQDISERDASAEGIQMSCSGHSRLHSKRPYSLGFKKRWNSHYGRDSWDKNPWVWVIEFEKVK